MQLKISGDVRQVLWHAVLDDEYDEANVDTEKPADGVATVEFDEFRVGGSASNDITITGIFDVEYTLEEPDYEMDINGEVDITNYFVSKLAINAGMVWDDESGGIPSSVSGSVTADGATYGVQYLLDVWTRLWVED